MRLFRPLPKALVLLALAGLLSACGDELTDTGLLESAEADAVLRSAAALPALPAVITRAGDPPTAAGRAALFRAQELWAAGTATGDVAGRSERRLAVRYAAPVLAGSLDGAAWDDVRRGLLEWIHTAETMLQHLHLVGVDAHLASARGYIGQADAAVDPQRRAHLLLLAGVDLVETTPRFVARRLAAEAEATLEQVAADPSDGAPDPDLERARRLTDWANRAVAEGEYLIAAQRAYYAMQLVEGR